MVPCHSYHKSDNNPFSKLPIGRIKHTFEYEDLEEIIDKIEDEYDDEHPSYTAIVIDDFTSDLSK